MKTIKLFVLLGVVFLSGCGGGLSTVGNPRGATINVSLEDDVGSSEEERVKAVTVSGGEYTPDVYILGLRHLSLIRCTDSSDADMECPGARGIEVDPLLDADEEMITATLNDSVFSDQIIYTAPDSVADDSVGNADSVSTEAIEDAGLYSAVRLGLDFLITSFPGSESNVSLPGGADGFEFALYCLNEDGCSTTLGGYSASYLDGLADGDVEPGDIVFLNSINGAWYWWDLNADSFSLITAARPSSVLTQGETLENLVHGDDGEWVYNSSFGSTEGDGLVPLNITDDLIDAEATDTLTMVFSVETAMSFDDDDGDDTLDTAEMGSFRFGKPRITEMSVSDGTFSAQNP